MTPFAHPIRAMLRATGGGPFAEAARADVDGHQGSWPGVTDEEWRVAQQLGQRLALVLPDRTPPPGARAEETAARLSGMLDEGW